MWFNCDLKITNLFILNYLHNVALRATSIPPVDWSTRAATHRSRQRRRAARPNCDWSLRPTERRRMHRVCPPSARDSGRACRIYIKDILNILWPSKFVRSLIYTFREHQTLVPRSKIRQRDSTRWQSDATKHTIRDRCPCRCTISRPKRYLHVLVYEHVERRHCTWSAWPAFMWHLARTISNVCWWRMSGSLIWTSSSSASLKYPVAALAWF